MIRIKRAYEEPSSRDGTRVLVDRLWLRGVKKEAARIDEWRKELAPSNELRKWFGHDPAKWETFKRRYRQELTHSGHMEAIQRLAQLSRRKTITPVYGATEEQHNQAAVLKRLIRRISERLTGLTPS